MTDWKALCAELANTLGCVLDSPDPTCLALIARARTALAEGAGVGVTDEELLELSAHHGVSYTMSTGEVIYPMQEGCDMRDDVLSFARAVLAHYGTTHPRPIPVAERLPTDADCDAEGKAWWWYPETIHFCGYWQWEADAPERDMDNQPVAWLPAAAIPLPEVEP